MMLKLDNVFPDVPDEFHERITNTLESIKYIKSERKRTMKLKPIIAIAAVIALVSTISAGAYTIISNWNPKMSELWEVDEATQVKLSDEGVSQSIGVSTTDNGVTMNVLQTLADKNMIYILLEFVSEDKRLLDVNQFNVENLKARNFEVADVELRDEPFTMGWSQGAVEDSHETFVGENGKTFYRFYYTLSINTDVAKYYNGKTATLSFKNACDWDTVIIEGHWETSWTLDFQDRTKIFEFDRVIEVGGAELLVKAVELSPISLKIIVDDGRGVIQTERGDLTDEIMHCWFEIIYDDGEIFNYYSGGSGGRIGENSEYITVQNFRKILDVERVSSIRTVNNFNPEYNFEISLID